MKKRTVILRIILTALSVAAVAYIFHHSMMNADDSTVQSDSVMGGLNGFLSALGIPVTLSEYFIRKTAHFVEYFVLGGLLSATAWVYVHRRARMLIIALPAGLAVAVTDELIQTGSPGRSGQVSDVALDFGAVLTAALLAALLLYLREKRKIRKRDHSE